MRLPALHDVSPFRLIAPGEAEVGQAEAEARVGPLSYGPVGATRGPLPDGYDHDVQRGVVGRGEADWERAVAALQRWKQFDQPWLRFHRPETPLEAGSPVVFSSWQYGVWALNLCRIVEVVDHREGAIQRFGFSYGTLAGHTVAGEERFELAWDRDSDEVTFEIRKFSELRHWMVRALGPLARRIQARFSRDAIAAMRREVEGP